MPIKFITMEKVIVRKSLISVVVGLSLIAGSLFASDLYSKIIDFVISNQNTVVSIYVKN